MFDNYDDLLGFIECYYKLLDENMKKELLIKLINFSKQEKIEKIIIDDKDSLSNNVYYMDLCNNILQVTNTKINEVLPTFKTYKEKSLYRKLNGNLSQYDLYGELRVNGDHVIDEVSYRCEDDCILKFCVDSEKEDYSYSYLEDNDILKVGNKITTYKKLFSEDDEDIFNEFMFIDSVLRENNKIKVYEKQIIF